MLCASLWEAWPFLNGDKGEVDGEESTWERGEYRERQGRESWLVCKINEEQCNLNKKKTEKDGGKKDDL